MRRLRNFLRRNPTDLRLWLEALGELVRAKLLVHGIPFRRLAPSLGCHMAESAKTISPPELETARRVSWAVQSAARHVRLGFVCLPQAIAAQRMLRRRGVSNTLYLGVAQKSGQKMTAHAWLRAGPKLLTGAAESRRHRTVATFADIA